MAVEILPGRLFQEQRSVVGRSVLNITLISYTSLCYVRNVVCEEKKMSSSCSISSSNFHTHYAQFAFFAPRSNHSIVLSIV